MSEPARRIARHLGVLARWAEAQKQPAFGAQLHAEIDVHGRPLRGLTSAEYADLVAAHREALRRAGLDAARAVVENELAPYRDVWREWSGAYRAAVEQTGFDPAEHFRKKTSER